MTLVEGSLHCFDTRGWRYCSALISFSFRWGCSNVWEFAALILVLFISALRFKSCGFRQLKQWYCAPKNFWIHLPSVPCVTFLLFGKVWLATKTIIIHEIFENMQEQNQVNIFVNVLDVEVSLVEKAEAWNYIHGNSSIDKQKKVKRLKWAKLWLARPFSDSWLVSSGLWESEADWLRLEHISYRFPENCIFLDSCLRDSHTAAASSGHPAMATFAQSWKSSQDLQRIKFKVNVQHLLYMLMSEKLWLK